MRQIKFRAWDADRQKMITDFSKKTPHLYQNDDTGEIFCGSYQRNMDWQEPVLMQYTGLNDKNGQEIYEGDIISIPADYDKYGHYAGEKREVFFNEGAYRLKPKWDKDGTARGNPFDDVAGEIEVIGNIYANPELLASTNQPATGNP